MTRALSLDLGHELVLHVRRCAQGSTSAFLFRGPAHRHDSILLSGTFLGPSRMAEVVLQQQPANARLYLGGAMFSVPADQVPHVCDLLGLPAPAAEARAA